MTSLAALTIVVHIPELDIALGRSSAYIDVVEGVLGLVRPILHKGWCASASRVLKVVDLAIAVTEKRIHEAVVVGVPEGD